MLRPGANPVSVRMDDVLCDFCGGAWDTQRQMIEGHKNSCICQGCLAVAYAHLTPLPAHAPGGDGSCTMCRESRAEPHWESPLRPDARICRRCARQAAVVLERDPDAQWHRPRA